MITNTDFLIVIIVSSDLFLTSFISTILIEIFRHE
jgi:hypothetical protein